MIQVGYIMVCLIGIMWWYIDKGDDGGSPA